MNTERYTVKRPFVAVTIGSFLLLSNIRYTPELESDMFGGGRAASPQHYFSGRHGYGGRGGYLQCLSTWSCRSIAALVSATLPVLGLVTIALSIGCRCRLHLPPAPHHASAAATVAAVVAADPPLLDGGSPFSPDELAGLSITTADFEAALRLVQPSALREGFETVP